MRLLAIALLTFALVLLVAVALVLGYRQDQGVVRWFPGSGISAKLDVIGVMPDYVRIENEPSGQTQKIAVLSDGTFIAQLDPGDYRLALSGDRRSITLRVPENECVELVLDYRFPGIVLVIPGDGGPGPHVAS